MITAQEVGDAIQKWGHEDPRTKALLQRRCDEMLLDEAMGEPTWWWLSFAAPDRFLGLALVHAPGYMSAVTKASQLGINPGGEVAGFPLPSEPPEEFQHVLLDKETAERLANNGW